MKLTIARSMKALKRASAFVISNLCNLWMSL